MNEINGELSVKLQERHGLAKHCFMSQCDSREVDFIV